MDSMKDILLSTPKFRTVKGERVNTLASSVLGEVDLLQIKSAIKTLNQRMREFERAEAKYGASYTQNSTYKNLSNWADALGRNKGGYAVQSTKNLTVAQALRTMAILKNPNANLRAFKEQNARVAEAQGEKIDRTITGVVRNTEHNAMIIAKTSVGTDRIHDFVEQHASYIYALQANENDMQKETLVLGADSLVKGLKKGWNEPLDETDTATMLDIIAMFDSKNAELEKVKQDYVANMGL